MLKFSNASWCLIDKLTCSYNGPPQKIEKTKEMIYSPCDVRRSFHEGVSYQWHMMVICIWCALFVMSQFDIIFMVPNQRFGEAC